MNIVEALGIAFKVDTSELDKGLNEAQGKVSNFAKNIQTNAGSKVENLFKTIFDFANNFSNALAGVLGVGFTAWLSAFITQLEKMKQEVRALNDLTKEVNADVEDISAWSNAVEFNGGNAKSFQNTLMSLQKDLNNFSVTGKSRNQPMLEMLGIDINEASGKPIFDLIGDITKAVEGMDKAQSKNILKKLGFDSDTIELIQSGTKNIDELITKQKEWGIYTKKDTEALDKMDKSIKQMSLALKSTFIPLFTRIVQISSRIVTYVTKAALWLRDNLDVVRKAVILLAVAFSGKLLTAIKTLGVALMKNPFALFIMGITTLLLLLEDLYTYASGGESAFEGLWEKLGTPEEVMKGFLKVKEFFENLGELVESGVAPFLMLWAVLSKILIAIGALASLPVTIAIAAAAALAFILTYYDEINKYGHEAVQKIEAWFSSLADYIRGIFGIGGSLNQAFDESLQYIDEIYNSATATIKDAFSEAFGSITELWNGLQAEFDSGCSAIAGYLSSAADSAMAAWNRFITWLEEKWNWLKGLLPSFEGIASRLPSFGNGPQLAVAGAGGNTTTINNDNKKVDVHTHTPESTKTAMKSLNLVSQVNGGNGP